MERMQDKSQCHFKMIKLSIQVPENDTFPAETIDYQKAIRFVRNLCNDLSAATLKWVHFVISNVIDSHLLFKLLNSLHMSKQHKIL